MAEGFFKIFQTSIFSSLIKCSFSDMLVLSISKLFAIFKFIL